MQSLITPLCICNRSSNRVQVETLALLKTMLKLPKDYSGQALTSSALSTKVQYYYFKLSNRKGGLPVYVHS